MVLITNQKQLDTKEQALQIILSAHCNTKMKYKIKFIPLIGFLLLYGCMAKPKQPPLTEREAEYFALLSKSCNCVVSREVDVKKDNQRINEKDKGYYTLTFDSLTIVPFNNIDSLKALSLPIAKRLYNSVLNEDFKYKFDHINIFYSSQIDKVNYMIKSFTFKVSDLK
jgi:hypothetical protein